jgi:transposase
VPYSRPRFVPASSSAWPQRRLDAPADERVAAEEVWAAIEPLLPPKRPHPKGGRPWIEDRAVLGGIIYVLRAGISWRLLPAKELGCGSGVTCWRRLRDWQAAGVWEALHYQLLDWLGDDGQVDWSRAAIDSVSVRARREGTSLARIRSIGASQAPSITCWSTPPASLWRCVCRPPIPTTPSCWRTSWTLYRRSSARVVGPAGRASAPPSCTPTRVMTSRPAGGRCAAVGSARGSPGVGWSPARGWAATVGGGASLAWLLANRRLTIRYERRADILQAFLHLACALICAHKLRPL